MEETFYVYENGNKHNISKYEKITGTHSSGLTLGKTGTESWYLFDGTIAIDGYVYVYDTVNLILSASCIAELDDSIVVEGYNKLAIWGQELQGGNIYVIGNDGDAAIFSAERVRDFGIEVQCMSPIAYNNNVMRRGFKYE